MKIQRKVPEKMIHLIPAPKILREMSGKFPIAELENLVLPGSCPDPLLDAAVTLADEIQGVTGTRLRFVRSGMDDIAIRMKEDPSVPGPEAYGLSVRPDGIEIKASAWTGFFYAIHTLRQLIRTEGAAIPLLEIEDAPDFAARGFYHDCTRGKVPTLETLFRLADKMAYYKLNQLQLYVEHTFAFARHSDMWSGADPLTAEEILRLDSYCAARNIELIPSLSTFGHFYMGLRSKRKEHLNELDVKASEMPFSFTDRMRHYTLNPLDPGSIELVEDMLAEYLPLFRSRYFNICCDETFDLGKGKNAKLVKSPDDVTNLYCTFLKKVIAAVNKHGKSAMFWGDIIVAKPELIRELPPDTIPLEWDYGAQAAWHDTSVMQASGLNFYICPGVSGWNKFLNDIGNATQNIINYAKKGKKYGAVGLLNTDWGDKGHVNLLSCSWHGMALGAACAWNVEGSSDPAAFDRAFSRIELGDDSGEIVAAWRKAAGTLHVSYGPLAGLFDPAFESNRDEKVIDPIKALDKDEMRRTVPVLEECAAHAMAAFTKADPLDPLTRPEMLCAFRGERLMQLAVMAIVGYEGIDTRRLADEFRAFETEFAVLWHKRNKPSEYYRIRQLFMEATQYLDSL